VLDPAGSCVWNLGTGGYSPTVVLAGPVTYLAGTFSTGSLDVGCGAMTGAAGSHYVAQLDAATGACLWSRTVPGNPTVTLLSTGELVLSSPFTGTVDVGCGALSESHGTYLAKLDTTGACAWSHGYGAGVSSLDVTPFPSGDVGLSVTFTAPLDLGCGPDALIGSRDLALSRLDGSTGACLWDRHFGSSNFYTDPPQLAVSAATGYVYAMGYLPNGGDGGLPPFTLNGYDGSGALRFQNTVTGLASFALDPCGSPVLVEGATVSKLAP
jgi:hypothetical protein